MTMREMWWPPVSKRPDLEGTQSRDILDQQGDEIFKDVDSIAGEINIDKEITKKISIMQRNTRRMCMPWYPYDHCGRAQGFLK